MWTQTVHACTHPDTVCAHTHKPPDRASQTHATQIKRIVSAASGTWDNRMFSLIFDLTSCEVITSVWPTCRLIVGCEKVFAVHVTTQQVPLTQTYVVMRMAWVPKKHRSVDCWWWSVWWVWLCIRWVTQREKQQSSAQRCDSLGSWFEHRLCEKNPKLRRCSSQSQTFGQTFHAGPEKIFVCAENARCYAEGVIHQTLLKRGNNTLIWLIEPVYVNKGMTATTVKFIMPCIEIWSCSGALGWIVWVWPPLVSIRRNTLLESHWTAEALREARLHTISLW